MSFGKFFLPGPTEVRQEILSAMLRPMIPHRSAEFEELFARLQAGLRTILRTTRPVYIVPASATGMMEAAIRCSEPGRVLCLVNGAFSERFAHIAEMCGRKVDRYLVPWGSVHAVDKLDEYLTKTTYRCITVVHSETSTGALNDVRAISDQAHSRGVRCLVDSVSGAAGAALEPDVWKLDYVLTGSQKAFALPPGLAFAVASEDFIRAAVNANSRGVYFDLVELEKFATEGQVPSTPSLSLLYALDAQLETMLSEGIENRWKRHQRMADLTSEWLDECRTQDGIAFRNIVDAPHRSPTVSTIELPPGSNATGFLAAVRGRGFTVASGYGKLKATTFRIGHMGDHTPETLLPCLTACRMAISS